MNKKQKFVSFLKSEIGFFLIIFITIILLFIFLSPKISTQLFAFKRQMILNQFLSNTIKDKNLDSQKYWEFREFYSPGYFIFSREGLEKNKIFQGKEKVGINYNDKNIDLTFLVFSSPRVNSLDMLTKQTDLNKIVDLNKLLKENIIYVDKNSLIYKQSPNIIKIIFLMDNTEMQKANGFFKYTENDKQITQGENWFNISSVTAD